jgi:hypothetical protein
MLPLIFILIIIVSNVYVVDIITLFIVEKLCLDKKTISPQPIDSFT